MLNNEGTVSLAAIWEDEVDNNGSLIRDIIASSVKPVEVPVDLISDPDTGAWEGIAVIAADSANGTWQFSLDNGTVWNPLARCFCKHGEIVGF